MRRVSTLKKLISTPRGPASADWLTALSCAVADA